MKATVRITPRKAVLDPQGRAVQGSLHALGFEEVSSVRVGRLIELELDVTGPEAVARERKRLDEMCRQLLANELIEDYHVEIEGEERA